ncbi:MAG: winged helix-turn-helix transcriptional regulator [Methanobacteriaceae archaeon]|nr:winged helix-turn-helix transcriptional regulator [Candidatus Methanorudis spinitermitis]
MIRQMELTYGSMNRLKNVVKRNPDNMKLFTDLDEWRYFLKHPNEKTSITKVYYTEDLNIGRIELELLNFIKNKKPRSINELSNIVGKDISSVQRKVSKLEKEGLITFEKGLKNSKKPVLNYDKIEIAI